MKYFLFVFSLIVFLILTEVWSSHYYKYKVTKSNSIIYKVDSLTLRSDTLKYRNSDNRWVIISSDFKNDCKIDTLK
jgi:hypothetical protein